MENLTAPASTARPRKHFPWRLFCAGLLVLAFVIYFFQPALSAWGLRKILVRQGADRGCKLAIGKVEADFFAGLIKLTNTDLVDVDHPKNEAHMNSVTVDFSPWRLLFEKKVSPVNSIALEKGSVNWKWIEVKKEGAEQELSRRNYFPGALTVRELSANLECGTMQVVIRKADFSFQPDSEGELEIPDLTVSVAPWTRHFSNLEGTTAIKDRGLYVGGIRLGKDLVLERGALDFKQPEKRKTTADLQFTSFGGECRADFDVDLGRAPARVEAGISFWNISVKQLGSFLSNDDLAEGILKEGRFTFRGNPVEPAKANMSMRLNATNFRWKARHWNSLVFSGLLLNRRIEIPQFELVQDKNQIRLTGHAEMNGQWTGGLRLPEDFQLQVQAQIDDLDEATKILIPAQKILGGEAFFAGEVRNQKGKFSGNLKMRGGPLEISGISVDRMRGDLTLHGSEVSATDLEFTRRDDTAKGWATLDFQEPRPYSGEFAVKAANVADYAAILPTAAADYALAGGVDLWWSGDGTSTAHSGAFNVTLHDFILSRDARAVPIDVKTHGSYSPGGITLNKLTIRRPNITLETTLVVLPDSMELRGLQIAGSGGANVSGNLTLPLNLFSALKNPAWKALLDSKAAANGKLTGTKIKLEELGELSGVRSEWRGKTDFELTANGILTDLEANLQIKLDDFSGPKNLSIPNMEVRASIVENHLSVRGEMNPGEKRDNLRMQFEGATLFSKENLVKGALMDPAGDVNGKVESERMSLPLLHEWLPATKGLSGEAGGSLQLRGTPKQSVWEGKFVLLQANWQPEWLDFPLEKMSGQISYATDQLTWEKVAGRYRKGTFEVNGTTGLDAKNNLNLTISGKSLMLASKTDRSEAVVDADANLAGSENARQLSGKVRFMGSEIYSIESRIGAISGEIYRELRIISPVVNLPSLEGFKLPWLPVNWTVDLVVSSANPLKMAGEHGYWLVNPELSVKGTALGPDLTGKMDVRPYGDFLEKKGGLFYFIGTRLENGFEVKEALVATSLWPARNETNLIDGTDGVQLRESRQQRRLQIGPISDTFERMDVLSRPNEG